MVSPLRGGCSRVFWTQSLSRGRVHFQDAVCAGGRGALRGQKLDGASSAARGHGGGVAAGKPQTVVDYMVNQTVGARIGRSSPGSGGGVGLKRPGVAPGPGSRRPPWPVSTCGGRNRRVETGQGVRRALERLWAASAPPPAQTPDSHSVTSFSSLINHSPRRPEACQQRRRRASIGRVNNAPNRLVTPPSDVLFSDVPYYA